MDADDIGTVGEAEFNSWCAKVGIVADRPTRDRSGWDFFLTLPAPGGPNDAPERSVKVQVKTTSDKAGGAAISLKNWRRMVTERGPWFVLHLVLDGNEVTDAFLVHIDAVRVADVLKRLREVDQGIRVERTMTLTPPAADRLAPPWPEALRSRLLGDIDKSEDAYWAAKAKWAKEAGYAGARHGVSVGVAAGIDEDPLDLMADWIVGLRTELPVRTLHVVERRFGIDAVIKDVKNIQGMARLEAIPPVTTATITLTSADKSERVVFETEVRVARRYLPWLPPEYERLYFVGKGLSFLFGPSKGTVRALPSLPREGRLTPLSDVARVGRALRMLSAQDGAPPEARFECPEIPALASPIQGDLGLDAATMRFVRVMEWAAVVARHFDIPPDVAVDPGDLMDDALQVAMLVAGLERSRDALQMLDVPCTNANVHERNVIVLVAPAFVLANDLVGGIFGLTGRAVWSPKNDGRMRLIAPSIRCFAKIIAREEDWAPTVRGRVDDAIQQLASEGFPSDMIFRPRLDGDDS